MQPLSVHAGSLARESLEQRVDQLFAPYEKPGSPGCALGVIQDGRFVYRKGYGTASLELGIPISSQSVFYMGSVAKQFTAASIVLAAEQGFLSFDDSVRKYIPEFPEYYDRVTLRQLLHQTSGVRDYYALLALSGRSILDRHPTAELIDLIARQKSLNFQPGSQYRYSNSNYLLLGEIIKRATGKPLSAFADENIFRPLGMVHTRFYDDSTVVVPGRIPAYEQASDGSFRVAWSTNFEQVGAGGLMSTIDDLLLWDQNFYKNRLGKGTLIKEMLTKGVLNDGQEISHALGLLIESYRGQPIAEYYGGLLGYRTGILRFPQQRFTVLCLCNLANADMIGLSHDVANIYLERTLEPLPAPQLVGAVARSKIHAIPKRVEPPQLTDGALKDYVGTYTSAELDATYDLDVQDSALMLRPSRDIALRLVPVKPDVFRVADVGILKYQLADFGLLQFQKTTEHRVSGLTISSYSVSSVSFEKH